MGMRLRAVLFGCARMRLGFVMLAGLVMMRGLAMMMRCSIMMCSGVMMMLAGCVLSLIYSPPAFFSRCVSAGIVRPPVRRMGPKRLSHRGFTGWAELMGWVR